MAKKTEQPRFEIRTNNPSFTGDRCGVKFAGGVGYTDDANVASGLANLGYKITDREAPAEPDKNEEELKKQEELNRQEELKAQEEKQQQLQKEQEERDKKTQK